ncbi:methyltransferase domain-containing protein [Nakamurella sp. GG22]
MDATTSSADYSTAYFHDYSGPPYTYEEPHWRSFFGGIADSLIELFAPETTYDAGCAKGFLVRALAERGVDARGGDISEYATTGAPPELADRLEVRDLVQPLDRRYDLITCIEVLEHMSIEQSRLAVANLCAATDLIVLSTTPDDFDEATHINIRQPAAWAQDFAVHGFFRRTDIDAGFISPWATVFARARTTATELVTRYEAMLAPLLREVDSKRRALLQVRRELDESLSPVIEERDRLVAEVASLHDRLAAQGEPELSDRAARLAMVDELIVLRSSVARLESEAERGAAAIERAGLQATIASLVEDLAQARERLAGGAGDATVAQVMAERDQQIAELKQATTWRVGRAVLAPFQPFRGLLRRSRR